MVLKELITKWGIKADTKGLKQLESGISDVSASLAKVAAIGAAAAGTLFGIAKITADLGDETAKTAKSLGINAQALQELQFAAGIGGVKQNDFNKSVQKFSKNILEARRGSETYLKTFRELGVSSDVINNKQLKTDQLLGVLADKFKELPDGVEKTGLAMELFGRSGPRLLPLLNEGAAGMDKLRQEARDLGGVMDSDLLASSEEFQDSMLRMNTVLSGLRNFAAAKLIPVINKITDTIKEWFIANREIINQKIDKFIKILMFAAESAFSIFQSLFESVRGIVRIFGDWETVIKFVTTAIFILLGAQLLIGIGSIAQGVMGLVGAFRSLGFAALLANAKAMLIPLLIGAGIVALGLAIDDIVSFFKGEKSVTGLIVKKFKSMFDFVVEGFKSLPGVISKFSSELFDSLISKFNTLPGFVQGLIKVLMLPFNFLLNNVKAIGGVLGALTSGDFGGAFDAIKDGINSNIDSVVSIGNDFGLGSNAPASTSNNSNVSQNNQITVQVPDGLTPDQAAEATRLGVEDSLGSLFRKTQRAVASPIVE